MILFKNRKPELVIGVKDWISYDDYNEKEELIKRVVEITWRNVDLSFDKF